MSGQAPPVGSPWWLVRDGVVLLRGVVTADAEGLPVAVYKGTFRVEPDDRLYCGENPEWERVFTEVAECRNGTLTVNLTPPGL